MNKKHDERNAASSDEDPCKYHIGIQSADGANQSDDAGRYQECHSANRKRGSNVRIF